MRYRMEAFFPNHSIIDIILLQPPPMSAVVGPRVTLPQHTCSCTRRSEQNGLCKRAVFGPAGGTDRRTCMPIRMALPSCYVHQVRRSAAHQPADALSDLAAKFRLTWSRCAQTPARDARIQPHRAARIHRYSQTVISQSRPMCAEHPCSDGGVRKRHRATCARKHARTSPSTACNEMSAHAGAPTLCADVPVVRLDGPGKKALQLPSFRSAASIISKTWRFFCGGVDSSEAETLSVE